MYARGMSTREIVGHLRDLYGIEVSPGLISAVTDAVLEEIAAWQAWPLEAAYPLVFLDALRVRPPLRLRHGRSRASAARRRGRSGSDRVRPGRRRSRSPPSR